MAIAAPTPDEVRAVIETEMTDEQISVIIADATLLAERCIADLDANRQKAILRYLTAHIIVMSPNGPGGGGQITSSSLGDASDTYAQGQFGKGLQASSYGQLAIGLDPNGCLVTIGNRRVKVASVSRKHNHWRGGC